ncbi:MAG: NuoI/complex I 23 kDa subunit family protein [Dehalococcoidia bacterium]
MRGILKGLTTTVKTMLRSPVTVQYPDKHLPMAPRFMGFPGLLWDDVIDESKCVGCQVCARYCPTDCIYVTMKDNEKHKEGKSHRKKMVDDFVLDFSRCIVCGICVEVCNFDAIVMTHEHESGNLSRRGLWADMDTLHEMGRRYEEEVGPVASTSSVQPEEEEA